MATKHHLYGTLSFVKKQQQKCHEKVVT